MSNAEWLGRPEPTRVPVEDFEFKLEVSKRRLGQMYSETSGGDCLANQIATSGNISRGSISYGGERVNEDGSAEQLVGCGVCGAMCTITYDKDLYSAVSESEPRTVLSITEAPQPNPWMELGTFDDCKAGEVKVPDEASALAEPVGLDGDQRQMVKILTGHID